MKKIIAYIFTAVLLSICFFACQKDSDPNSAINVQNLAGTYALKGLIWNSSGANINVYDSLDACEKDNLTTLNADKTVNFIDAGIACTPPEDDNGTWDLKGDSLFFSNSTSGARIESFDGTTLILQGAPEGTTDVTATTTYVKQ